MKLRAVTPEHTEDTVAREALYGFTLGPEVQRLDETRQSAIADTIRIYWPTDGPLTLELAHRLIHGLREYIEISERDVAQEGTR